MVTLTISENSLNDLGAYLDWFVGYEIIISRETNSFLLRARAYTELQFKVCFKQYHNLIACVRILLKFIPDCEVVYD